MAQYGPPKQSATLSLIKGNPSKLPASALTEALRPRVGIPDCPDYLLDDAKAEWQRLAPELKRLHLISQIDLAAFATYCQGYAQWVLAQRKIKELGDEAMVDLTPNGYKQISAWAVASQKALEQMRLGMADFGLSPMYRTRITPNLCTNIDLFNDFPDAGQEQEQDTKPHGPERFFTR